MTLDEIAGRIPARPGRRRLSFEEVVAAGRPAVFSDFGDSLLYLDGKVFVLREADLPADPAVLPPVLDMRAMVRAVGIETGWRHAEDCDCDVCSVAAA